MKVVALALLLLAPAISNANVLADMEYFPKEVSLVLGLDFAQLQKTAIFKSVYGLVENHPEFKKFNEEMKTKTGIDLKNDTQSLVFGFNMDNGEPDKFVMAMKGNFSEKNLEMLSNKDKAKKSAYKGKTVYVDGEFSITMHKGRLVFGTTALIHSLLDGTRAMNQKALSQEIAHVKNNPTLWFSMIVPAAMKKDLPKEQIGDLDGMTGLFWIKDDIKAAVSLTMGTDKDAAKLAALADMQLKQMMKDPQMAAMPFKGAVERLQIKAEGRRVVSSTSLTAPEVQMIQMFLVPMLQAQMGGATAPQPPIK
ncbi:hypothetical protein KKF91_20800 [Myxococcota bacterium]|nr:hypothetical protein [Myxococcota bacterium]